MSSVYVVGTFDTKGDELRYVAALIAAEGVPVTTVDVGNCAPGKPGASRDPAAPGGLRDCLVFHATGTGGRSMEKLADDGLITGVLDISTTEVCDLLMGGVMSAGQGRLDAIARTRVPYVGSCGALDMVNFGARDTVPERYRDRILYEHNPQVTLMRTTPGENERIGAFIAAKLNACEGPVRFLIPEGGVSMIDAPGQPFHDPEADRALFAALEREFRPAPDRRLIRLPQHINDPEFAAALASAFRQIS